MLYTGEHIHIVARLPLVSYSSQCT